MMKQLISSVVKASSVCHFTEAAQCPDWLWVSERVQSANSARDCFRVRVRFSQSSDALLNWIIGFPHQCFSLSSSHKLSFPCSNGTSQSFQLVHIPPLKSMLESKITDVEWQYNWLSYNDHWADGYLWNQHTVVQKTHKMTLCVLIGWWTKSGSTQRDQDTERLHLKVPRQLSITCLFPGYRSKHSPQVLMSWFPEDQSWLGIVFQYYLIINLLSPVVSLPVTQTSTPSIRWCSATMQQSGKIHSLQELEGT